MRFNTNNCITGFPSVGCCEIFPSRVNFGQLLTGSTAQKVLTVVNIGNDVMRFKIKQQPESRILATFKQGPVLSDFMKLVFAETELISPAVGPRNEERSNLATHSTFRRAWTS